MSAGPLDAAADGFGAMAADRVGSEVPGVDLELFHLSFTLSRVATRFIRRVESVVHRPAGLTWAGFRVLFTIWVCGSLESHRIAHFGGLSRASVSSAVNTLERDGLVSRSRNSDDRRLVTVSLTEEGRRRVRDAYADQHEVESVAFGGLSGRDRSDLIRLLDELLAVPYTDG